METLFSYMKILENLINYKEIINWVKIFHKLDNTDKLKEFEQKFFLGYRFILSATWKSLISSINSTDLFNLKTDKVYDRALFYEKVNIDDIPITCEKTAFLMNLYNLGRDLYSSNNIFDLKKGINKIKPFLRVLANNFNKNVETEQPNKQTQVKILTIYNLYTNYHNTGFRIPFVLNNLFFRSSDNGINLNDCMYGYIFSLQFIWSKLLNHDEFSLIKLDRVHMLMEIFDEVKENYNFIEKQSMYIGLKHRLENLNSNLENLNSILENFDDKKIIQQLSKEKIEIEDLLKHFSSKYELEISKGKNSEEVIQKSINKHIFEDKNSDYHFTRLPHIIIYKNSIQYSYKRDPHLNKIFWGIFDLYYFLLRQLINKYSKVLDYSSSLRTGILNFLSKPKKKVISKFIGKIEQFDFNEKNYTDDNTALKRLKAKLFWYKAEVMTNQSTFFNGTLSFNAILLGICRLRGQTGNDNKIYVKIFKHPENSISLGILVDGLGSMGSDYSGWIVFYKCANYGYGGFGPSLFQSSLNVIKENIKFLDVEEIEVSNDLFLKLLDKIKLEDYIQVRSLRHLTNERFNEISNFISNSKGRLLESFVYKWLICSNKFDRVYWNRSVQGEEIDLFGILEFQKLIMIYECTITIHGDKQKYRLQKIKDKIKAIKKEYKNYSITGFIVTYKKIEKTYKDFFAQNSIQVIDNFKEIIEKDKDNFPKRDSFIKLLEFSPFKEF